MAVPVSHRGCWRKKRQDPAYVILFHSAATNLLSNLLTGASLCPTATDHTVAARIFSRHGYFWQIGFFQRWEPRMQLEEPYELVNLVENGKTTNSGMREKINWHLFCHSDIYVVAFWWNDFNQHYYLQQMRINSSEYPSRYICYAIFLRKGWQFYCDAKLVTPFRIMWITQLSMIFLKAVSLERLYTKFYWSICIYSTRYWPPRKINIFMLSVFIKLRRKVGIQRQSKARGNRQVKALKEGRIEVDLLHGGCGCVGGREYIRWKVNDIFTFFWEIFDWWARRREVASKRFASWISLPNRIFVVGVETFSTCRRVYQPAEGGPAIGFLRSGSSTRLA